MKALLPLGLVLVAAGCGSQAHAVLKQQPATKPAAQVSTRHTKLGTVLVDADGRTLYLFEKDRGSRSSCYGSCASVWPPLVTGAKAVAGGGVLAAKLGASPRSDGQRIVTYAGHPLYTYAGDGKPGDVHGQGADQFGAEWYVLAPDGTKVDADEDH